ncbi:type II secretion system protein [bacterium]|uniref:Pili assembly chaperone n=2 Tax=Katanobacteria TaxID=422282 RepID=A0A2M7X239_UNCKA|nr:type II secretion system protein [bacterium]PIP56970.1 MAG: hypothetical protein COX05_00315 [candidate division WWE3 bacterium CG22_combo_CG10-13_8_21_14_all_39_12]PJA40240.1 MAG: hypothetical protein CO179_02925 [candidate division WWE3 bacterium CG_4_9_14_3_um_filter_39_7]
MKLPKFVQQGFTLIELLVVIAVLGILAAVVLVAIDPGARIDEANDAGVRSNVSQVATAVETCFTAAAGSGGDYDDCNDSTELIAGKFLKAAGILTDVTISVNAANDKVVVYGTLEAASAACPGTTTGTKYWTYRSDTGESLIECGSSAPTPTT